MPSKKSGRPDLAARFARWAGRARWFLLATWLLTLVLGGLGAQTLADKMTGGGWAVSGGESELVQQALRDGFEGRGRSTVVLVVEDQRASAADGNFEDRIERVLHRVSRHPDLSVRTSHGWSTVGADLQAGFLGADRRTTVHSLGLAIEESETEKVVPQVQRELSAQFRPDGLDVSLVSVSALRGEVGELAKEYLIKAELVTLPLLVIILLLLYRGVVAALASLAVAVTAVTLSLATLSPIAGAHEISVFVENMVTMLGLGVGVDYSLFVIKRFKEELASGKDVEMAIAATLRTAGHTVIASGLTVVLAMATLFVIDLGAVVSMTIGAVLVVAFSVMAAVLILPVLLALLGDRINAGRVRLPSRWRAEAIGSDEQLVGSSWYRMASGVMRRPLIYLLVTSAVLVLIALPALQMRIFTPDAQTVPTSSGVRAGYDHLEDQFGTGAPSPIQVVLTTDQPLYDSPDARHVTDIAAELSELPGTDGVGSAMDILREVSPKEPFAALRPVTFERMPADLRAGIRHFVADDNRTVLFEVRAEGRASDDATHMLLRDVRAAVARMPGSLHASVGGESAEGDETNRAIEDKLVLVLVLMLAVVYLVLLATFRSLLLPVKAMAMNLISVGAAYGVLVMIFQHGWGASLIGVDSAGYLVYFVPVLLLALLFSLGTDYEVFLLSRVREEYLRAGDNTTAVARGVARTAPLISGAALLMIVVFFSFGMTGVFPTQQLGLGMAVGVALDATLVRMFLVPSAMRLMGRWNWWLPRLRRQREAGSRGDLRTEPREDLVVADERDVNLSRR